MNWPQLLSPADKALSEAVLPAPADVVQRLSFFSPWLFADAPESLDEMSNEQKHLRLRSVVMDALVSNFPMLVHLLQGAGAQVIVFLDRVYIALPTAPHDWIAFPEMDWCLRLTPWAEREEIAH